VSGLSNCTGDGHTQVYVPVPMIGARPIFPENYDRYYNSTDNWSSRLADTDHGKMYLFQTNDTNLTDIDIDVSNMLGYKSINEEKNAILSAKQTPNYTSYIYLEGIRPDGNVTLNYTSKLRIIGTHTEIGADEVDFNAYSSADIPANTTGWVPVTVQVMQK